jgi:hypothetical protein
MNSMANVFIRWRVQNLALKQSKYYETPLELQQGLRAAVQAGTVMLPDDEAKWYPTATVVQLHSAPPVALNDQQ